MSATPPRDRWIPWTFAAVFVVVAAVNGVMVALAFTSWTGLVGENAYEDGLRFNDTLDAAAAQQALGWTVEPRFAPAPEGHGGDLSLVVADASGRSLEGAVVTAAIRRPLQDGLDATLALTPRGAGTYGLSLSLPMPGAWDVAILIEHGAGTYRLARRLDVP